MFGEAPESALNLRSGALRDARARQCERLAKGMWLALQVSISDAHSFEELTLPYSLHENGLQGAKVLPFRWLAWDPHTTTFSPTRSGLTARGSSRSIPLKCQLHQALRTTLRNTS